MKKTFFALSALTLMLAGCDNTEPTAATTEPAISSHNGSQTEAAIDETFTSEHTAYNSLDWQGTYQGVLPCADCAGIEYTLTLNDDLTYTLTEIYQTDEETKPLTSTGKFHWDKNGSVITLEDGSDSANQYFVGENILMKLDINGEKITGDLATLYHLKKQ
ncbi:MULTISPECIES: copper resistance protein NlpE [Vibrio]|uniref:copper resistance protein NlpE n=1 Tax=Vibrio TaxID=662 RepID=UPI000C16D584|nr:MULTISPECIES: copper resistance protein NlpE [Vibrio]NAW69196.1 copper resistance protein NlpE [Vibrio sp. V28_P6S34P95]NAX05395.1 copper resistance protein NlpE [Vibrio sp. V30_P3S12P165]NAX34906.1 copper resistance protein NlpE [Vibrio sp. V29_P1S30P107]NAX37153.1 copper resistance protein NlpE [Vibrio sp. V27_P1S3P104]NAX39463.1 copper resistance protein NlpE [Vibrio sp. V26_P1S5P106]